MPKDGRFWRNIVLIALAHIALIAGLIRWSLAARASNPDSIVWLGAAGEPETEASPPAERVTPLVSPKPQNDDKTEEEKPMVTTAKSEIELPPPIPKPTPKKILLAKATPASLREAAAGRASSKPSPKEKSNSTKSDEKSVKNEKSPTAKTASGSQNGSGKTGSTGKGGSAGGGSSASEFGWYGNMLHDRFYSAWIQPTTSVPSGSKISTLVKVRIEKDGRVSKFEIIKASANVVVNESVATIAKRVTEVDAPPTGLIKGDHYDVKINFELNNEQQ